MNLNIIIKILCEKLPEDIIREISKYFIQKIPKDDIRFEVMEYFLYYRKLYVTQGFYSDGKFRYNLFQFGGSQKRYFLLRSFPDWFLEYNFCIDDRISSIRFWNKDNKCEVPSAGYWVKNQTKYETVQ